MTTEIICADNLAWMESQPGKVCDLALFSPPYEAARLYAELGFKLRGQEYVDWLVARIVECLRITRGPVVCVVEGQTRDFAYSATPILAMADLHRRGVTLRKPPIYRRNGISGSGGREWLRNDYEFCVVATNGGPFAWADNTAMGSPPNWRAGGEMSNRLINGERANGNKKSRRQIARDAGIKGTSTSSGSKDGDVLTVKTYLPPTISNPGNVISETYTARELAAFVAEQSDVIDCVVGGGVMGSKLCHENEAPFPERLAEFFIRSFCPPGGTVLDIFCGSGTSLAVAKKWGRNAIGIDVRPSQVELSQRRVAEVNTPDEMIAAAIAAL